MGRATLFVDPGFCARAQQSPPLCRSAYSSTGKSGPIGILTVGDSDVRCICVRGYVALARDFSTRDAADILVARLVSRGVRAKVFRAAETQRRAA